jgi:hypothetical protein
MGLLENIRNDLQQARRHNPAARKLRKNAGVLSWGAMGAGLALGSSPVGVAFSSACLVLTLVGATAHIWVPKKPKDNQVAPDSQDRLEL